MDTSIFDPPIPYVGRIVGGKFTPGKMVRIQGLAPGIGYRFNINLQCGPETTPRDDVAVQLSVRLLDGYIAINSLQHGIWGEEQSGALPVKRNEKFEIIVMCDSQQFKIAINGQHYCEFPQRIHHSRITHLAIDGDVSIFRISFESAAGATSVSASAPIPTPPADNEEEDFEMIDTATNRPPQSGVRPPPPVGFSQPPSYDVALDASSKPPYPTSGPVGMPYPTHSPLPATYPKNAPAHASPYPPAGISSYPPSHASPYPPAGVLPTTAPTPLNAPSSSYRPVKHDSMNTNKICAYCFAIIFGIILIIVVVISKVSLSKSRQKSYAHDPYYSNSYDSSRDDYNPHGSNNYGGYNSHNNHW